MKPYVKAIIFLVVLTALDFLFRKGFLSFLIPFQLPNNTTYLLFFSLFAVSAWLTTKWFSKSDGQSLSDFGISFNASNRIDFLYGFILGVVLWGVVSIIQSYVAGFSWIVRPNVSLIHLLYGLVFIFVADLGTELFTRGYPLTRFKDSFGAVVAIVIMVLFVALKSISFDQDINQLMYAIAIPALHTIFFSIIYFKTKRLGGALGLHTGANLVTISIFDLRPGQPNQAIPSGFFTSDTGLESLSLMALQMPYVLMAVALSVAVCFWHPKSNSRERS